ncbi:hypothetical protein KFE25_007560 [Diacronema lutheri]|uniref:Uncharacterized protein n=2 Tax=Diacronema lutheri TaxID=2081491 RepID=A0A8J6CBR0_DIALT|nr:hypothetical protein KFE25_007560 [Diacronema lutheri]
MAAGLDVAGAPAVHSEPASQPPTLRARSVVWPTDLPDPFGHGLGPNAERIRERIAAVRREGHRRRLRVQLPALCVGCVCAVGAVVIVVTQARWWLYGFTSLHMAPFFVLLSLMPTDITALRAYLAFAGAVILFALWWLCVNVLQPSRARLLAAEMRSGSGGRALGACSLFVIAAATMLALARVAMLLADTFVSRRSAAVALVRAWRFVSIVQIVFGIVYSLVFLAIALDHEANASFFRRMTLRHIFIADGMVALCTLTLGLLGLWPPLRSKASAEACDDHDDAAARRSGKRDDGGAQPSAGLTNAVDEAYALSEPATLGEVDAFLSHSWHDAAADKFAALQAWRALFKAENGREPLCWYDRCCIDQTDIAQELTSLPIYLGGCNTLVALAGPTFLQRLWCVIELHIFFQMHGSPHAANSIHIQPVGDVTAAFAANDSFDVRTAHASDPRDAVRLLSVIEGHPGGAEPFNEWVRSLARGPN